MTPIADSRFESLRTFRARVPGTLIGVLIIVAALEGLSRAIPQKYLWGCFNEIAYTEELMLPHIPAPKILFMGSSRIRDSLVPKQLDRFLNLPEGSTANLGMNGTRVFESINLYDRNEAQLSHAKWVFLNVDEWHLSAGARISNSVYELNGPLFERLRFPKELRPRLMMDGIFSMRVKLRLFASGLLKKRLKWRPMDANNQAPYYNKYIRDETYPVRIKQFYQNFAVQSVLLDHVAQLAGRVRANGGKFVLMQLPNKNGWQNEVNETHGADYARQKDALKNLADKIGVPFYHYERPEDMGLNDSDFEDYGHVSPGGAAKVTVFVGGLIQKLRSKNDLKN